MVQVESVVVDGLFTLVGTVVVYYIVTALTGGSRVSEDEEIMGLDESVQGKRYMNN